MGLFQRLSETLWEYVSPRKVAQVSPVTSKTREAPSVGLKPARKPSLEELARNAQSLSPSERVKEWRFHPSTRPAASSASKKRKRVHHSTTPTSERNLKIPKIKMEVEDMDYASTDMDGDTPMEEDYEEDRSRLCVSSPISSRSRSPGLHEYAMNDDSMSVENTLVVGDAEYVSPPRKIVALPELLEAHQLSTHELRQRGWDDDYITLIQKLAMRGHEPLLPAYMKFEYRWLPDGLFEQNNDSFLGSLRGDHFRASKAMQSLFNLGGRVRDRGPNHGPEAEIERHFKRFHKWAQTDAGLDEKTAIPILAHVYGSAGAAGEDLKFLAARKCRRLARRWRDALRVHRSVEFSPASRATSFETTPLAYEMPTFYAVIASHMLVALVAYRAHTDEATPMAYLDYSDPNLDVWNSLALAIVACHVRNVQLRIAEDTMIGQKVAGSGESSVAGEEDPDL